MLLLASFFRRLIISTKDQENLIKIGTIKTEKVDGEEGMGEYKIKI